VSAQYRRTLVKPSPLLHRPDSTRSRTDMPTRTHPRQSYTVGIICALDVEKAVVEATLDEEHGRVQKAAGDDNAYTFGKIGAHNVVVACLPAGVMGKVSATAVAKDMMRSFPIKVGLMVGICGGVWSERADIRLGDVVVSQPDGVHGGVVQWDYGKMERDGVFRRTGTLNKPPRPLLHAVQSLNARHMLKDSEVGANLATMFAKYPRLTEKFGHQGPEHDELFEVDYQHDKGESCADCDRSRLCNRPIRTDDHPQIHYGNIASGDQVVKDGPTRDQIAREEGILCFEMEAAGLMDTFPCVVIRGVCDYADSHKNKRWQPYAAATAACYAKELLGEIDVVGLEQLRLASESNVSSVATLRRYEEVLGGKHRPTVDTLSNLGDLYKDKGKSVEAKEMYERAVKGYGDVEVDREAHIT
jgi:nucleoside phosphorylase